MITAIIDMDPFVYAAGFAVEHTFYDVNSKGGTLIKTFEGKKALNEWLKEVNKKESDFRIDQRKEAEPLANALNIVKVQMNEIRKRFNAEQMLMFLTDDAKGRNFRDYVAIQCKYKDRPSNARPIYYKAIREFMVEQLGVKVITGFEADDAVATQAWATICYEDVETVLVSIDKDLDMVPGRHYNPVKKELYHVTAKEAIRHFYQQLLMGDKTDNVPGLPRIGEKKAADALAKCDTEDEMYDVALSMYRKEYGELGLLFMVEQARLLWMLRWAGDCWLPRGKYLREKETADVE